MYIIDITLNFNIYCFNFIALTFLGWFHALVCNFTIYSLCLCVCVCVCVCACVRACVRALKTTGYALESVKCLHQTSMLFLVDWLKHLATQVKYFPEDSWYLLILHMCKISSPANSGPGSWKEGEYNMSWSWINIVVKCHVYNGFIL